MKTVKIAFYDFWNGFEPENCLFYKLLSKHFKLELSDDPDYVFYSVFGERHWAVPNRCVKVFYTGENLAPDFNACDYAMGFEWMDYEDRYRRVPNYLLYSPDMLERMEHKHELPAGFDLKRDKPDFCSFVVSNPIGRQRNEAFKVLSTYKKVSSGGRFLNNVGGPVQDKLAFEEKHRFSLCFENGRHSGYTTEKLIQAFAARTIPIYWGDPNVGRVFNKAAFVDAADFGSTDALVERIKELDYDDAAVLEMLSTPALVPGAPSIEDELRGLEEWLAAIFERPLEEAYRRSREMHGATYIRRRKCLRTNYLLALPLRKLLKKVK